MSATGAFLCEIVQRQYPYSRADSWVEGIPETTLKPVTIIHKDLSGPLDGQCTARSIVPQDPVFSASSLYT
jgi:hypothetical protein